MFCGKCGAKLEDNVLFCGECGEPVLATIVAQEDPAAQTMPAMNAPVSDGAVQSAPVPEKKEKNVKPYKPRRKPHIVLRVLLQLLSLVLCLVLSVSLIATVVLADLNHIMSGGGMKQIVNAILMPTSAPHRAMPVLGAMGIYWEESSAETKGEAPEGNYTIPGDLDVGDIPDGILTGGSSEENMGALVDWLYEAVEEAMGGQMPLTKEEFSEFVADSTISEFMAEKLTGFAEDFINGTADTVITTEEVQQLLDENLELIEEKFGIQLTDENKAQLSNALGNIVEQVDINTVIRDQVFDAVEDSINDSASATGITWEQLQPMLQTLCADTTLYIALGICGGLMLLLCLLNFYNVPAGLTWIAVPCLLIGAIMTAPLLLLPTLMPMMGGSAAMVLQIVTSFVGVLLPIHAAVPVFGFVLLVISIVWRIVRANADRKRRMAAAAQQTP